MVDPKKFSIIPSLAYGDFPQVGKDKARCDHYQYNSEDLDVIVIFLNTFNRVESYFLIDKLINMEWVLVLMKNQLKEEVMAKVKSNLKITIKDKDTNMGLLGDYKNKSLVLIKHKVPVC